MTCLLLLIRSPTSLKCLFGHGVFGWFWISSRVHSWDVEQLRIWLLWLSSFETFKKSAKGVWNSVTMPWEILVHDYLHISYFSLNFRGVLISVKKDAVSRRILMRFTLGAVLLMEEILALSQLYKLNDTMGYLPYHLVSQISSINRELQK